MYAAGVAVRLVLLVACAAAYIALRLVLMAPEGASHYSLKSASLAESQLIRRAENPLAFVRGRREWALSVGWLQVYFAKLLFVPTTYCVEYSYDCVPMVEELSDGRNALTLALLLALLRFAAHLLARAGRADGPRLAHDHHHHRARGDEPAREEQAREGAHHQAAIVEGAGHVA